MSLSLLLAILALVSLAIFVRLQIRTASKNRFTLIEETTIMSPMWFIVLPIASWMFPDIWTGVVGHFFMSWGYVYHTVLTGVLCVSIGLSFRTIEWAYLPAIVYFLAPTRPQYIWNKAVAIQTGVILMAFGLGMMWESIPLTQWDSNVHTFVYDTLTQWLNITWSAIFILVWMGMARYWGCTMGRAFLNGLMCSAKAFRLTVKILKRDNASTWAAFWFVGGAAFAFGHSITAFWSS